MNLAVHSMRESKLVSILLVMAVAAAAGFQIPNAANLAGFTQTLLDEGLRAGSGDVRVSPRDRPLVASATAEARRIGELTGARAAIPLLSAPGAVERGQRIDGALVLGLDATAPIRPFHLRSGSLLASGDERGLLLGTSLAANLDAEVGDEVSLRVAFATSAGAPEGAGAAATPDTGAPATPDAPTGHFASNSMIVRGIVGGSAFAYRSVFVDRGALGRTTGVPDAASVIVLHLDDHYAAPAVAAAIAEQRAELAAVTWMDADPYLPNYIRANQVVSRVSYAMVIAAVTIPVWALLYIQVLRRRREIGIMTALGFRQGEVFAVFLLGAAAVACAGCLLGSALGYLLILYFAAHPIFEWEGLIVIPVTSITSFAVPCATIFCTTIVAGAYPAWKAARTDPASVLRGAL